MALRDWVEYLRIGYKHLGRGFVEGDCFNLALLFYKTEFGIEFPDFTDYEEDWASKGKDFFLTMYKEYGFRKIKSHEALFGDVILLRVAGKVSHIGVVVDPERGYFLHTTKSGTAVHNYLAGAWSDHAGFLRYKKKILAKG